MAVGVEGRGDCIEISVRETNVEFHIFYLVNGNAINTYSDAEAGWGEGKAWGGGRIKCFQFGLFWVSSIIGTCR